MQNQLSIEFKDIYEFEITENLSIFYDKKQDLWYALTNEETETIIIQNKDFEFEEITIEGFTLTKNLFEKYKRIIENG
jgi:hypothetical protein